jgi:hypothetical protein
MNTTVTTTLLRQLINSGAEDPVLYLDTDRDEPELDVWAGAEVDQDNVVITRESLLEWLGDDWTDEQVADYLPELQETVADLLPEIGTHFTAWLVNDPSALEGDDCDVTVLADAFAGYRRGEPDWSSTGEPLFHALTGIDARGGDIDDAQDKAEQALAEAGWTTTGDWEALDNSYVITVVRADDDETWTLQESADHMGAANTNTAMRALKRLGVEAVGRAPGRGGQSLYRPAQVMHAHATRPGQGARTDLQDGN